MMQKLHDDDVENDDDRATMAMLVIKMLKMMIRIHICSSSSVEGGGRTLPSLFMSILATVRSSGSCVESRVQQHASLSFFQGPWGTHAAGPQKGIRRAAGPRDGV